MFVYVCVCITSWYYHVCIICCFFFKQKTAYELRISDWSSDVCSSDLFLLEFQPLIEIGSGRVIGAEALIRWAHPERELVMPGSFVPIAEESGAIVARSEERRVGKECVSTCRSRWSP